MEYYTNDELNMKKVWQTLFLSLVVFIVGAFIDIALPLNKIYLRENVLPYEIIGLLVGDMDFSIITFVVTMFISHSLFRKDNWCVWLIGLFTVLSFTTLVIFKVNWNELWLLVALICTCLILIGFMIFFLRIKFYIKNNGRRLPF